MKNKGGKPWDEQEDELKMKTNYNKQDSKKKYQTMDQLIKFKNQIHQHKDRVVHRNYRKR